MMAAVLEVFNQTHKARQESPNKMVGSISMWVGFVVTLIRILEPDLDLFESGIR